MINDYDKVAEALADGTPPELICGTCPWTRSCIEPPEMNQADLEQMLEAGVIGMATHSSMGEILEDMPEDLKAQLGDQAPTEVAQMVGRVMFGHKVNSAKVCPVLAQTLRESAGAEVATAIKNLMSGGSAPAKNGSTKDRSAFDPEVVVKDAPRPGDTGSY